MDNDFQDQVNEDLNENSQEPATKGDLRNFALRIELRLMNFEKSIDQRFANIEQRFTNIDQRFMQIGQQFIASDSTIKEYVYKLGWKFFAATIGTIGVMFTVFAMIINSSLNSR